MRDPIFAERDFLIRSTGLKPVIRSTPDPIVAVAKGLLEMHRSGVLSGLWIDRNIIRLQFIGDDRGIRKVGLKKASEMVAEFRRMRQRSRRAVA